MYILILELDQRNLRFPYIFHMVEQLRISFRFQKSINLIINFSLLIETICDNRNIDISVWEVQLCGEGPEGYDLYFGEQFEDFIFDAFVKEWVTK